MDDLHDNPGRVDQHWRPQHLSCPFCLLNFTVYGKVEELDQDSLYLFTVSNLTSRINYKQKLNSANDQFSSEKKFWSQVEASLIPKLEQPWSYLFDFQMFEYDIKTYMEKIGVLL